MAAGRRRRRAPECSSMGARPTWAEYIDLPKASCELISRAVYVFGSVPLSLRMLCTLSLSLFLSWFIPRSPLFRILYTIGFFDQRPFFSLTLAILKAVRPCVENGAVSWSVLWVLSACNCFLRQGTWIYSTTISWFRIFSLSPTVLNLHISKNIYRYYH